MYKGFNCNGIARSGSLNVHDHIDPLEVFNVSHTVVYWNFTETYPRSHLVSKQGAILYRKKLFETTEPITEGEVLNLINEATNYVTDVKLLT